MCTTRWLTALALAGLGVGHRHAAAEPTPDPRIAKADELFVEGRALLSSNLLQACAKFDESLRYNPAAIGTLLNVALCDEKLDRVASAVARFSEARDHAKEQGLVEHQRAAEQHIAALAPSVPHLSIKLTEALPRTTVVIDDRAVALDALASIAVDPGERVIVVIAPERLPVRLTVVIGKAEHKDVVIPVLARSIAITSSRRRIGQLTTVAGAALLGGGIGLGLYANNLYEDQFGHTTPGDGRCDDALRMCERAGQTHTDRARTLGNVGTAVSVAGIVVAGVGAYLWLGAPRGTPAEPRDKRLAIVPSVSAGGLGVAAVGQF